MSSSVPPATMLALRGKYAGGQIPGLQSMVVALCMENGKNLPKALARIASFSCLDDFSRHFGSSNKLSWQVIETSPVRNCLEIQSDSFPLSDQTPISSAKLAKMRKPPVGQFAYVPWLAQHGHRGGTPFHLTYFPPNHLCLMLQKVTPPRAVPLGAQTFLRRGTP